MLEVLLSVMPLAQLRPTDSGPATNAAVGSAPTAAQTGVIVQSTTQPGTTEPAPKPSIFGGLGSVLPIVLMFVVLYFVMFRGQKKTEKNRKKMLAEMKKGDEVMTIGGMVARIVSMDDDEVVLKIDESANVKARYKKSAIQQVLTGDEKTK